MTEVETFPQWLLASLRCPATGVPLELSRGEDGTRVLVAVGHPERSYEIVGGVPVLLTRQIGTDEPAGPALG